MAGNFLEGFQRAFGPTGQNAEEFLTKMLQFLQPEAPQMRSAGRAPGEVSAVDRIRDAIDLGGSMALEGSMGGKGGKVLDPRRGMDLRKGWLKAIEEKMIREIDKPPKEGKLGEVLFSHPAEKGPMGSGYADPVLAFLSSQGLSGGDLKQAEKIVHNLLDQGLEAQDIVNMIRANTLRLK